jgi:hypothetical protein
MQPIPREQMGKYIPVAMNIHAKKEEPISKQWMGKHTTIGVLLEIVFSLQSVQSVHKEEFS